MSFFEDDIVPIIGEELLEEFSEGDLVRWCGRDFIHMKTGIILDIYVQELSSRGFPTGKVYVIGEDAHEDVLLSNLITITAVKD